MYFRFAKEEYGDDYALGPGSLYIYQQVKKIDKFVSVYGLGTTTVNNIDFVTFIKPFKQCRNKRNLAS